MIVYWVLSEWTLLLALRVLEWSVGNRVPLEGARRLPRVDPLSVSGRDIISHSSKFGIFQISVAIPDQYFSTSWSRIRPSFRLNPCQKSVLTIADGGRKNPNCSKWVENFQIISLRPLDHESDLRFAQILAKNPRSKKQPVAKKG